MPRGHVSSAPLPHPVYLYLVVHLYSSWYYETNRKLNAIASLILWKVDSETKTSMQGIYWACSCDQPLWGKGKQQDWAEGKAGLRRSCCKYSAKPTGSSEVGLAPQRSPRLGWGLWALNPAFTNHRMWAAPGKAVWPWEKRLKNWGLAAGGMSPSILKGELGSAPQYPLQSMAGWKFDEIRNLLLIFI